MKPTLYPEAFYIVHHRFTGAPFKPGGVWGDIADGPACDDEAVIEAMIEAWKDEQHEPDATDFRVTYVQVGKAAEDCTAWALRTMLETLEERMEARGMW